ncbi:hypothetical protein ABT301_08635 [Streptomyces sp. NPDC000987]|uniref:hypothetical protein n=1 Tax=Streptomyces sp. NPDC000987 TaxID=3154374 RepID=UPI0033189267
MTSSLIRGRPRRAASHISVRVLHTVLGGFAGMVWLALPGMTAHGSAPAATRAEHRPAASTAARSADEASPTDLVLPLAIGGAVGALAGFGYVRHTRRARQRTATAPGTAAAPAAAPPLPELEERAGTLLAETDDCVRVCREELGFAEALSGAGAVAPFARAVRDAEAELSAAFRMRQRYDDGVPEDEPARRHMLAGIVGRCQEAGRRLDAETDAFDRLRGPDGGVGGALGIAEVRFRELTGRATAAEATLVRLTGRYAPSATRAVSGHAEQATDRLFFATSRLNRAHQAADLGRGGPAARDLRAAEGATAQAATLLTAVDQRAAALSRAEDLLSAALTGAEAELAEARKAGADTARADGVLADVREEVASGRYDPLDALRRVVRAVVPLGAGRAGVLSAAALLVARDAADTAACFVATHRGAVGGTARTRLAEAQRLLVADAPGLLTAESLARSALELAEQDARDRAREAMRHANDLTDAVLAGVLLDAGTPPAFGGPRTRARLGTPPPAQPR